MEAALKLLAVRARSIGELRERLILRGVSREKAEDTISRLVEKGYLDDKTFSRERAETRLRLNNWGRNKIAAELRAKGVDPEIVKNTIEGIGEKEELFWASEALKKWLKRKGVAPPLDSELENKALRFLSSRGFPFHISIEALKNLS